MPKGEKDCMISIAYIMNEIWFSQQRSTHSPTNGKRFGTTHIDIYCCNIFTPETGGALSKF